jgi:hypothetical protein
MEKGLFFLKAIIILKNGIFGLTKAKVNKAFDTLKGPINERFSHDSRAAEKWFDLAMSDS